MSIKILPLLSLLVFVAGGCAQAPEHESGKRWTTKAPFSAAQVGFLISGPSRNDIDRFLTENKGTARVLDERAGLYEVFGVSPDKIARGLPQASIAQNRYFRHLPASAAEDHRGPPDCKTFTASRGAPAFQVVALTHGAELEGSRVLRLRNTELTFAVNGASELDFFWDLDRPGGPSLGGPVGADHKIRFNADAVGRYLLLVMARSPEKVMSACTIEFGVTEKRAYLGQGSAPRQPGPEEYKDFGYLEAVHAIGAWTKTRGEGAKIAILDSGVNYNHPDLSPNIMLVNGKPGWDFVSGDGMPFDDLGHGTHIAGLAAGAVFGVAPRAKILPVKVMNALGDADAGSIIGGIHYAVDSGVDIIVLSIGTPDHLFGENVQEALDYAEGHDVLVVISAGNFALNTDEHPVYPAVAVNANILSVAATTFAGTLESYSDYGQRTISIGAPGGEHDAGGGLKGPSHIAASTGGYVRMGGTSMAAPVAAGVAALVTSYRPQLRGARLKEHLLKNSAVMPALAGKLVSPGVVDAGMALDATKTTSESFQRSR